MTYLTPFRIPDIEMRITNLIYTLSRRYLRRSFVQKLRTIIRRIFSDRSLGKSLLHKFIKATLRHCRASQRQSNSGHSRHEGEQSLFFSHHVSRPALHRQLTRGICSWFILYPLYCVPPFFRRGHVCGLSRIPIICIVCVSTKLQYIMIHLEQCD